MAYYAGQPPPSAPPASEEDYYRAAAAAAAGYAAPTPPPPTGQPTYYATPYATGGAAPRYGSLAYVPPPPPPPQPGYGQRYAVSSPPAVYATTPAVQQVAWEDDCARTACYLCNARFTFLNRRHHCRNCGRLVCDPCSRMSLPLPHRGLRTYQRVCDACLQQLAPGFSSSSCHHHHC